MNIDIRVRGEKFSELAPLALSLNALAHINNCFEHAIDIVSQKDPLIVAQHGKPKLLITNTRIGSLDVSTITGFLGAFSPAAQPVLHFSLQAFDILSKGWKTIEIINRIFKTNQKLPIVKTIDSPDTTLQIGDNNSISITNDIKSICKAINPMFLKLAEMIEKKDAGTIHISSDAVVEHDTITFDDSNKRLFGIPQQSISVTESIDLECQLYRINKKTKRGKLDIMKNSFTLQRQVSFEIIKGDINKYIDALKEPCVIVNAVADYVIDAFNEKEISKLYLYDIYPQRPNNKLQ